MNVKQRADALGTFRYIEVRLMETAAYWTPITPEMEIKVLLGRHIWDFAQHADWLGKRTFELRQPEHYTRRATDEYVELLDQLKATTGTSERLAALYDVVVPGQIRRYEQYVSATDPILDAPSVVVVERILPNLRRQLGEVANVRTELGLGTTNLNEFRSRESAIANVVAA